MTKKETTALLEAVKNAPIVNKSITVTVCGTTFTFGNEWRNPITEDTRQQLIDSIGARCRKKLTRSISNRKLDTAASIRSQNYLLWWKDNIDKTEAVREAYSMLLIYDKKWEGIYWCEMSYEQKRERDKDYHPIEMAYKKLQIYKEYEFRCIANLRECVPPAWERA